MKGLLGHRLYFSGSPALRRSSRKALFIGSLIAQQEFGGDREGTFLQPVGNDGAGLLDAADARIDRRRDVRRDHFAALNGLKRFVIPASEIKGPGKIRFEKHRKGGVMLLTERRRRPFNRLIMPSREGKPVR